VKEETTRSWSARDVGAVDTLASYSRTDRKIRNGGKPLDD
jgi:hypothetical protein